MNRRTLGPALLLFCAVASGHGERSTTNPNPGGGGSPTLGGPRDGGGDGTGGNPASTPRVLDGAHDWRIWWAYNREWIFAQRSRARPISGAVRDNLPPAPSRKRLREGKLFDLMTKALRDKNQRVRAAAAIALGKFGMREANRDLDRRTNTPPSKWYTVRQASIFGLAALGDADNRRVFRSIAGDAERPLPDRSLAMLGFLLDGTESSSDEIVGRAKLIRKGIRTSSNTLPVRFDSERRRFATHLLGFCKFEHDELLLRLARGSREWGPGQQGLAITALGRRRAKDMVGPLFQLAYNKRKDDVVRRSVAVAMGPLLEPGNEDDIRRLARLIRDNKRDPITQHFGVMSLARIGGPHAIEILLSMARGRLFNNDTDRGFLYLALGLVGSRSEDVRQLLTVRFERARTSDERSVLGLACGLARARDALPALRNRLATASLPSLGRRSAGGSTRNGAAATPPANERIRDAGFLQWGVLALGLFGRQEDVDRVRTVFRKYADPRVRENAAVALALLRGRASAPELLKILRKSGSMHTKAAIVTALAILPEPGEDTVKALIHVYRDDGEPNEVRAMAVIALGAMADPRPVALSILLTRDFNYFIRCYALDWLVALL